MARDPEEVLWLNRVECGKLVKLTTRQFDAAIRPRLPVTAIRENPLTFYAPDVAAALVEHRLQQNRPEDGDPLLGGSDSPNLERYRGIKADLAQLELQRQQGTHICLTDIEQALTRYGSLLHRTGEILQRRFGNDAVDIFNRGLDEACNLILAEIEQRERASANSNPHNGNGQSPKTTDDEGVRGAGDHPAERPVSG